MRLNDPVWIPAFAGMTDPVSTACSTCPKVGFQTASKDRGHLALVEGGTPSIPDAAGTAERADAKEGEVNVRPPALVILSVAKYLIPKTPCRTSLMNDVGQLYNRSDA